MDIRSEIDNVGRRVAAVVDRLEQDIRRSLEPTGTRDAGSRERSAGAASPQAGAHPTIPALDSVYWDLRDLLHQAASREGLKDLDRDTRDTFRFFTRHIDFEAMRRLPRWQRYPRIVWNAFLAMAARLSPPRRLAFCVAVAAFLLGWVPLLLEPALRNPMTLVWLFLASGIFFVLLLIELRDKLSLKGDLEIAREIQFGLVPAQPVILPGLEVHAHMRPANTVGGDYYDVIALESGRVAIVVGDVAGKGMPAALMMALLQGSLRTLVTAGFRGSQLISKLNEYLYTNTPANKLVTLFYGELDTAAGSLRYINAGHNAPYQLRADGTFARLEATATVLGISPDSAFDEAGVSLGPEDRLVLFTDGVTEAFNPSEEEYGEQRLTEFLLAHRQLGHEELIQKLIQDVLDFCGSTRPGDDMTLMVVRRTY